MSAPILAHEDLIALPIFPLPEATLFPGVVVPLHVFEPRYRELTRDALAGRKRLALARLKPGFERDYAARPAVFDVCGAGEIIDHVLYADGRYDIVLRGVSRVRILRELPPARSYRQVHAALIADLPADRALCAALEIKIAELWHELAPHLPETVRDLHAVTHGAEGVGAFADRIAAIVADADLGMRMLAEPDPCERLQALLSHLQALSDSLRPTHRGRTSSALN